MIRQEFAMEIHKRIDVFNRLCSFMSQKEQTPTAFNIEVKDFQDLIEPYFFQTYVELSNEINSLIFPGELGDDVFNRIEICRKCNDTIELLLRKLDRMTDVEFANLYKPHDPKPAPAHSPKTPAQTIINNNYGSGTINMAINGNINIGTQTSEFIRWLEQERIPRQHIESFKEEVQGATKDTLRSKINNWINTITFTLGMADKLPAIIQQLKTLFGL